MTTLDTFTRRFLVKLGLRLREMREKRGWTLEECESHGFKNWRHLQEVEKGKNVTLATLLKVAKMYQVHVSDLLKDI